LDQQNIVLADLTGKVNRVVKQVENSHIDVNFRDDLDAAKAQMDAVAAQVGELHTKLDGHLLVQPTHSTTINLNTTPEGTEQ
jgi:hypothetical protein